MTFLHSNNDKMSMNIISCTAVVLLSHSSNLVHMFVCRLLSSLHSSPEILPAPRGGGHASHVENHWSGYNWHTWWNQLQIFSNLKQTLLFFEKPERGFKKNTLLWFFFNRVMLQWNNQFPSVAVSSKENVRMKGRHIRGISLPHRAQNLNMRKTHAATRAAAAELLINISKPNNLLFKMLPVESNRAPHCPPSAASQHVSSCW